jgi:hypothetical protein
MMLGRGCISHILIIKQHRHLPSPFQKQVCSPAFFNFSVRTNFDGRLKKRKKQLTEPVQATAFANCIAASHSQPREDGPSLGSTRALDNSN